MRQGTCELSVICLIPSSVFGWMIVVGTQATDRDVFVVIAASDMDVAVCVDLDDFVGTLSWRGKFGFLDLFVRFVKKKDKVANSHVECISCSLLYC